MLALEPHGELQESVKEHIDFFIATTGPSVYIDRVGQMDSEVLSNRLQSSRRESTVVV